MIVVTALGYAWIENQNIVRDATTYQIYSINESSRRAVQQLQQQLDRTNLRAELIGFYPRGSLREKQSANFLLRQFVDESDGLVELRYIDPDAEPLIAAQYGYQLGTGALYLAITDSRGQLIMFEPIGDANERLIATAMLRIAVAGQFKVYFITGHLEYEATGEGDLGLSSIYFGLPQAGISVDTLDLQLVDAIPDDATAIVIAGAQTPIPQSQVDMIAAYMQRGGRLLILADPPYADPRVAGFDNTFLLENSAFNNYLWREFGVRVTETLVSDAGSSIRNEFNLAVTRINIGAEILANFERVGIQFPLARAIEVVGEVTEPNTNQALYQRDVMLLTTEQAFGERSLQDVDLSNLGNFDEDEDLSGVLYLAVAVRRINDLNQTDQPRLVIMGDTDWLTNGFINPEDGSQGLVGNLLLWNSTIEWLTQYSEIATIPAVNRPDLLPLVVTDQQRTRIQIITLFIMPLVVLGSGILVWRLRR